jgi:RNA polymerase sigma factor (sigma-70 family)
VKVISAIRVQEPQNEGEPARLSDYSKKGLVSTRRLTYEHIERVYRYVLVQVRNPQVAEDITSDALLAAVEHINSFRNRGTLDAWLLGIARHKLGDYFRTHRDTLALDDVAEIASNDPSPAEVAERALQLDQISKSLRTISPMRRDALTLHVFADLSVEEVGHILRKSPGAVRVLIFRAIQDLKARLGEKL